MGVRAPHSWSCCESCNVFDRINGDPTVNKKYKKPIKDDKVKKLFGSGYGGVGSGRKLEFRLRRAGVASSS